MRIPRFTCESMYTVIVDAHTHTHIFLTHNSMKTSHKPSAHTILRRVQTKKRPKGITTVNTKQQ